MATLDIHNQRLLLTLSWHEKLSSLKGNLAFPIEQVASIEAVADIKSEPLGWRLVGSYFPRVFACGLFKTKGQRRALWVHYGKRPAVVIRFNQTGPYSKLVVHDFAPQKTVERLNRLR